VIAYRPAVRRPPLLARIEFPLHPLRAEPAEALPVDRPGGWAWEPQFDGFRCIAFRDGDRVALQLPPASPAHPVLPRGRGADERAVPRGRSRRRTRRVLLLRRLGPPGGFGRLGQGAARRCAPVMIVSHVRVIARNPANGRVRAFDGRGGKFAPTIGGWHGPAGLHPPKASRGLPPRS
jgi:hypothetical protein